MVVSCCLFPCRAEGYAWSYLFTSRGRSLYFLELRGRRLELIGLCGVTLPEVCGDRLCGFLQALSWNYIIVP